MVHNICLTFKAEGDFCSIPCMNISLLFFMFILKTKQNVIFQHSYISREFILISASNKNTRSSVYNYLFLYLRCISLLAILPWAAPPVVWAPAPTTTPGTTLLIAWSEVLAAVESWLSAVHATTSWEVSLHLVTSTSGWWTTSVATTSSSTSWWSREVAATPPEGSAT